MTKVRLAIALLFASLLLTGCGGGPGSTVEKFFEAVGAGEIDEAITYLSNSTIQTLGTDKWKAVLSDLTRAINEEGGIKSVEILDEAVTGDLATVTFSLRMGNGSEDTDSVELFKENDNWKIYIDPYTK